MRTLVLAGIAAFSVAASPLAAGAQDADTHVEPQTADEANAEAVPLPTTTTVLPGDAPGEPDLVIEDHHGNMTPPPQAAMDKPYPVCAADVQDECQNPGEGGAPGTSRALGYWPGEPASEADTGG